MRSEFLAFRRSPCAIRRRRRFASTPSRDRPSISTAHSLNIRYNCRVDVSPYLFYPLSFRRSNLAKKRRSMLSFCRAKKGRSRVRCSSTPRSAPSPIRYFDFRPIHSRSPTLCVLQVGGVGRANPYRLRPFVGARIPLNGSFVSSLDLHNPYSTTLRVMEMYTSGGDLHLELPDGAGVGQSTSSLWVRSFFASFFK